MEVTYIGHSGFLVETESSLFLFDYYKGELPQLTPGKQLYVFVSHRHEDHFNPEIFRLAGREGPTKYVLAFDIRLTPRNIRKWGLEEGASGDAGNRPEGLSGAWRERILTARAHETYQLAPDCRVETLRSTDEGVAYLVTEGTHTFYHAGDLHWWLWDGENPGWLGTMTANFKREVERIAGREIEAAFLPLDDRQERHFWEGMDWYLRSCKVRYVFPMHFWEDCGVVERFQRLDCSRDYDTVICDTAHETRWRI